MSKKKQSKNKHRKSKAKKYKPQIENIAEQYLGSPSLAKLLLRARKYPIYKCRISKTAEKEGMAIIHITRQLPNGNLIFAAYVIDMWCMGLKHTHCHVDMTISEYQEYCVDEFEKTSVKYEDCDFTFANQLIYGAIDYAASLGFKPDKDFRLTKYVLEEQDKVPPNSEIEFGHDGKPFYVSVPDDNVDAILDTLNRKVGQGNYKFTSVDEDDFDFDEFDEDYFEDEDDESNDLEIKMKMLNTILGAPQLLDKTDFFDIISSLPIVEYWKESGLNFDLKLLPQQIEQAGSYVRLAEQWADQCELGQEQVPILCLYIVGLCKKLGIKNLSFFLAISKIVEGIKLLGQDKRIRYLELWSEAWDILKRIIPSFATASTDIAAALPPTEDFCFHCWCMSFAEEMILAGHESDPSYYQKALDFIDEYFDMFPDEDSDTLDQMDAFVACAKLGLGDRNSAERMFEDIVALGTDNYRIYAAFADAYHLLADRQDDNTKIDFLERAKELYKRAISIAEEYDPDHIPLIQSNAKELLLHDDVSKCNIPKAKEQSPLIYKITDFLK